MHQSPAAKAVVVEEVDRLKWRLWNGKAKDAQISIDRINAVMHHFQGETDGRKSIAPSKKLCTALQALNGYLTGQSDWMVDYAERHRSGLRVGTAITEGTANFLVNQRMEKSQSMRWSRRGADLLLQVRCAVYNDTLGCGFGQKFYPANDRHPHRSCRTVSLSSAARPLLLRVQTDLLAMLAGARPRGPWTRSLRRTSVFDVLRRLTFVMLGPLWEGAHQALLTQSVNGGPGLLSETWTPGSLPPQIAAPALLAAVTFLAAESGTRLTGITWRRDLLIDGEDDAITAETLLWHLDRGNAQLVQDLFSAPLIRPFALLLAALRADRLGQGAAREATRRRAGLGAARRRARETLPRHPDETGQAGYRTGRFSISQLIEGVPPAPRSPARSPQPRATWQEAVAVYIVLGWGPRSGDILAPAADWMPELLHNRYVRLWIFRHRHLAPQQLISTLAAAIDAAHGQAHDIVLPELSAEPIASVAPVKLATRCRLPSPHHSRGR